VAAGEIGSSPEAYATLAKASDLNSAVKAAVGNANVYQITVKSGNVPYSSFQNPKALKVTLPYSSGSLASKIIAYHVDNNGKVTPIPLSAMYDTSAKSLTFFTNRTDGFYFMKASDVSFQDAEDPAWATEFIYALSSRGLVSGVGEGYYEPQRNITRGEMVTMIVKIFGLYDASAQADFADVGTDAWYYSYIGSAQKAGIAKGVDDKNFAPDQLVSRQDMAVMITRALETIQIQLPKNTAPEAFTDAAEIAEYAASSVNSLCEAGIIKGAGDGQFHPRNDATRAEVSKILWMVYAETLK
jgi:hypothetical protein